MNRRIMKCVAAFVWCIGCAFSFCGQLSYAQQQTNETRRLDSVRKDVAFKAHDDVAMFGRLALPGSNAPIITTLPSAMLFCTKAHAADFQSRMAPAQRMAALAADVPACPELRRERGARWVKPQLVVGVKHLKGTGGLRHASVRLLDPEG